MRRFAWVAAAVLAALVAYFVWERTTATIGTEFCHAVPAEPRSPFGNCIDLGGTYSAPDPVRIEAELGTRDSAGTFTRLTRPSDYKLIGVPFVGAGGVRGWSAARCLGLPAGTYVVRATLYRGGLDDSPTPLAVAFSDPLVLP